MRRIIASPHAPKAIGPYSQAVVTRHVPGVEHLHAAGQIFGQPIVEDEVSIKPGTWPVERQSIVPFVQFLHRRGGFGHGTAARPSNRMSG